MFEKMRKTHASPCDQCPVHEDTTPLNHKALLADRERIFTEARPCLLQLAYARRMSPDLADDVAQETLMEAWRHIEKLRDSQRIHAWLASAAISVAAIRTTPRTNRCTHWTKRTPKLCLLALIPQPLTRQKS